MPVHTFGAVDFDQPNTGSPFPTLNGDLSVLARLGAAFAPHETAPPSMAVAVDAGALLVSGTLLEIAAQATPALAPPAAAPRIDRVVLNRTTGAITVVTGTEAANPVPPAIPAGQSPLAQVRLAPGIAAITNALIKDERVPVAPGGGLIGVQVFNSSGTYTPTPGTRTVLVEVQGGGGSGGSCPATGSGQATASAGGAAGSYGRSIYAVDFSSMAITVGAGGAQPAAGANIGLNGTASSFGNKLVCPGGAGGLAGILQVPVVIGGASTAQAPTGANIVGCPGSQGGHGFVMSAASVCGGTGGASFFGGGGSAGAYNNGSDSPSPGAGGGGASKNANQAAASGGKGGDGIVIVYEYA